MKQLPAPSDVQIIRENSRVSVIVGYGFTEYKGNLVEAIAIILEAIIKTSQDKSFPYESINVRTTDKSLIYTLNHPSINNKDRYLTYLDEMNRIANASRFALTQARKAGYLHYSEEIAAELIKQEYYNKRPLRTISDLLEHFYYAPEIKKYINMLYAEIYDNKDNNTL